VGESSACKLNIPTRCPGAITRNNDIQSVCDKLTSMNSSNDNSAAGAASQAPTRHTFGAAEADSAAAAPTAAPAAESAMRDIAEVAAVEVITTAAVHLMSAAAVKCGLAEGAEAEELKDLDEARKLITALAGLVTAAAPEIGSQHAGPLRDGLRSLQLAFREASLIQDAPGKGPGEKFTGAVN
jgi:Domain of unknown function (DUF1844)